MDNIDYSRLFWGLVIIIIIVVIYYCSKHNCSLHSSQEENKQEDNKQEIVIKVDQPQSQTIVPPVLPPNPIKEFDYQTLQNPLLPPRTRDDWNIPLPAISTRGYPAPYHKLGMLNNPTADNNDKFKFLFLMGRRKYPSSSYFDYYITDANNEKASLKFDLPNLHKELYDGDTITIPELGTTYTVKMDRLVGLEYNPYVF